MKSRQVGLQLRVVNLHTSGTHILTILEEKERRVISLAFLNLSDPFRVIKQSFRKASVFQTNTFLEPCEEAFGANIVYGTQRDRMIICIANLCDGNTQVIRVNSNMQPEFLASISKKGKIFEYLTVDSRTLLILNTLQEAQEHHVTMYPTILRHELKLRREPGELHPCTLCYLNSKLAIIACKELRQQSYNSTAGTANNNLPDDFLKTKHYQNWIQPVFKSPSS